MVWFIVISCFALGVFFLVVRPNLKKFRATAGINAKIAAAETSLWQRICLRLLGMKTLLTAIAGLIVTVLPNLLADLHEIDFGAFVGQDIALKISGGIMLLMTVTHVLGMVTAAKIEPVKED